MQTFDGAIGLARPGLRDLLQFEQEPNLDGFNKVFRSILDTYGLSNAVYFCTTFSGCSRENPFTAFTYSNEWAEHYVRSNYKNIDPVVSASARSLLPVDWSTFDKSNRKVVKFFDEARQAGVGSHGVTIPIRGVESGIWASFSVTSGESERNWGKQRSEILTDLVLVANFLHQKAYELHKPGESIDLNAITRRETEALAWTSEGKSLSDIGTLMGISAETVKAHLDSARFKLGALNRVHAVAKAIRHGLIR
jgi:DNA-binding CsgD family transcriptional regulator